MIPAGRARRADALPPPLRADRRRPELRLVAGRVAVRGVPAEVGHRHPAVLRLAARTLAAVAALALGAAGNPLSGQAPGQLPLRAEVRGGGAVVVTLTVPAGSELDPPGRWGAAWLAAATLAEAANERLAALDASLSHEAGRSSTRFRLLSAAADWEEAWRIASAAVFLPPEPGLLEEVRARALASSDFAAGSPVAEFDAEADAFLSGGEVRASVRGTVESIRAISFEDILSLHRGGYLPSGSLAVVTGPAPALASVAPPLQAGPEAAGGSRSAPAGPASGGRAGERRDLRRSVTATWISIAWPARGIERTELELVADLFERELVPDPPLPSTYRVAVDIAELPGGAALVVEAALRPDGAEAWLRRALREARELIEAPPTGLAFGWAQRGFRGRRLLADADAALAGARISDDLLREGRARDLPAEISAVTPLSLALALIALGEPRALVFGPGGS